MWVRGEVTERYKQKCMEQKRYRTHGFQRGSMCRWKVNVKSEGVLLWW